MPLKGSRYQNAVAFSAGKGQSPMFRGYRPRKITQATGVLEYTIIEGDRLDLLALYFYSDSSKWWRILDANPDIIFGNDLTLKENIGETILVPRVIESGDG